jgi:hypothetical protein
MNTTTFSPKIFPQTRKSIKNYWKGMLTAKITFPTKTSPKISPQTEKFAKNYWKAGLYIANFVFALFLIRYGKLFSDAITIPSSIFIISVFLFAGFARLRQLTDGTNIKAYIKDHEALALILLTIFMVAGAVFYVAYQSRLDGRTVENPKTAHS